MKTFKLPSLLALIIINFSSCDLIFDHEPDTIAYNLDLSFQDSSGHDLVKGIGLEEWCCPTDMPEEQAQWGSVKRDLYVLDIIASQPCQDLITARRPGVFHDPDVDHFRLGMNKLNNNYYFTIEFGLLVKNCPNEKMLTYKLKCPYVFGDEAVHEFVTYWDIPKIRNKSTYAKCNRIEFEGRVFTQPQITTQDYYNPYTYKVTIKDYKSMMTIILEDRETQ